MLASASAPHDRHKEVLMLPQLNEYTDEQYWSRIWQRSNQGYLKVWEIDPAVQQQARVITSLIEELLLERDEINILEVGCANSFWLPYFAQNSRVNVFGLDYSRLGCAQSRIQLARKGVEGNIICQDFFSFIENKVELFDIIISFGFIEHFDDPSLVLQDMLGILRTGGAIFVNIPNMAGIYGPMQKAIDVDVYNGHVLLSDSDMTKFAFKAGYKSVVAGHIGGMLYLSVLNLQTSKTKYGHIFMSGISRLIRLNDIILGHVLRVFGLNINNQFSSPYVYMVAKK